MAESNPIYKIGLAAGGGLGLNFELTDTVLLSAGYFGDQSFDATSGNGLFNGAYSALGQVTWTPNDRFQFALTYVRGYFDSFEADALDEAGDAVFDLGVGTLNARAPFGVGDGVSATTNSYGGAFSFRLSPRISINGWGGYTDANQESGEEVNDGEADIFYYGLGVALPDLGKEGSVLGLFAGTEPYNTDADDYPALHVEAFYKYQLNDYISITPGVIWIHAPFGESSRDEALLGTIRTTFRF